MYVSSVKSQAWFQAKQRFVSRVTHENMKILVTKMNSETVYRGNSVTFISNILNKLKINKEALFFDNRYKCVSVLENPPSGYSSLEFNKVKMDIDNATGEIISLKKPWYKSFKKVIKTAERYIETALTNYDKKDTVSKSFLNISGFTEEGIKKLLK